MAETEKFLSINELYVNAKEEYTYQRNRMQRVENKVKVIITLLTTIFTFELANALNVLNLKIRIDSFDNFKIFLQAMFSNIPYFISLIAMLIALVLLIVVIFSLKCKYLDIVKIYNSEIYNEPKEVAIPFYVILYTKCIFENNKRFNRLYKMINAVIIFSIISLISFGVSYLF